MILPPLVFPGHIFKVQAFGCMHAKQTVRVGVLKQKVWAGMHAQAESACVRAHVFLIQSVSQHA